MVKNVKKLHCCGRGRPGEFQPIARVADVIACVYCGGEHRRPGEVKQCWADHQETPSTPISPAGRRDQIAATADQDAVSAADRVASAHAVPIRRGPTVLGRNVVVATRQDAPAAWDGCDRVEIDAAAMRSPADVVEILRRAAHERIGLVVSLGVDIDELPESTADGEPFEIGVGHSFELDDLHHLVWSNSIDARTGAHGRWALVDRAVARGATVGGESGDGDIVTPDGRPVWLDGGPVRFNEVTDRLDVVHAVQVECGSFEAAASNTSDASLAPDQLAAVTHDGGAARIIAPAGSGKTRVLTERARHLLNRWNLPPAAVTLVAFNKRAQEEMRERTADLPDLHVRTLNSIALAIVNGTPPFHPQSERLTTIDEAGVRRILGRLVQTPRKLNVDPLASWIDALGLVRLGLVAPADAEARYGGDVDGLADVWPHYRAALERERVVDFDHQIHRAVEMLLRRPEVRRAAQAACRVMLVDEFQDLTPAHLLLVRLLAAPGGAVFGVGDDDQTIYGYNGADPAWLIDFARWFPGAGFHPLEVNYRCPAGVVDVADRLLRHNVRRVDKTIRAASTDPEGWTAATSSDPVETTVRAVRDALASREPADVAVLARVNATLVPVQAALTSAGVPVAGGVGLEFLDRASVRAALAWMRLASGSRFAAADVGEAVRRPSRGLSPRLRDWASEQRDLDGLERLAARLTNDRDATKVRDFAVDLARLAGQVRREASTPDVIDVLIDEIGLGGAVATLDQGRHGMNRSAQGDDLRALRQLARLHPDVATFERWLGEQLATRRDPAGVVLSTVHRVKGQEWPVVVAHLVDADQYPHRLADDLEEERRLLHVAITRCREHVTIVSSEQVSPFVAELTNEPPEHPPEAPRRPAVRASRPKRDDPDHPLLDRSTVMAVPGLVLVDQGREWTITELEPEAAVAVQGDVVRRFPLGAKVETAGRQRGRLGARSGDVDETAARLFDLLRSYRDRSRNGKPAYTVFDDKTLVAIAIALPDDLAALAQVRGVGPAKLEQYGDDVLALVTTAATST